jgi:hypothetical protein
VAREDAPGTLVAVTLEGGELDRLGPAALLERELLAVELDQRAQVDGLGVDESNRWEQKLAQLLLELGGVAPEPVEPVDRGAARADVVVDEAQLEVRVQARGREVRRGDERGLRVAAFSEQVGLAVEEPRGVAADVDLWTLSSTRARRCAARLGGKRERSRSPLSSSIWCSKPASGSWAPRPASGCAPSSRRTRRPSQAAAASWSRPPRLT